MSATTTHIFRTSHGAYRMDITETNETVYVVHRGVRLKTEDVPRFVAWARPILDGYRDDPRPFEIAGELVNWTGRVEQVGGFWVGYTRPRGEMQ